MTLQELKEYDEVKNDSFSSLGMGGYDCTCGIVIGPPNVVEYSYFSRVSTD